MGLNLPIGNEGFARLATAGSRAIVAAGTVVGAAPA